MKTPFSTPEAMLAQLVGFNSVVGRPNAPIVAFVRDWLAAHGIHAHVLPGLEGDRANLFATIGPAGRPGHVLSGHLALSYDEEAGCS